jgi:hypothetical protein
MYQWLNRAPRGRNEARGPDDPLNWFRRHDEYHHANQASDIPGRPNRPAAYNHPDHPVASRLPGSAAVNPDTALKALAEPHRRIILALVAGEARPVGISPITSTSRRRPSPGT